MIELWFKKATLPTSSTSSREYKLVSEFVTTMAPNENLRHFKTATIFAKSLSCEPFHEQQPCEPAANASSWRYLARNFPNCLSERPNFVNFLAETILHKRVRRLNKNHHISDNISNLTSGASIVEQTARRLLSRDFWQTSRLPYNNESC